MVLVLLQARQPSNRAPHIWPVWQMMGRAVGDIEEGVSRILGKGINFMPNLLFGLLWELPAGSEGEIFDGFVD